MESSEDRKLRRLISQDRSADYELDLTGLDQLHALASIERMIERQRFRSEARDVMIKLDPAGPDSGETLFQPVGRALLDYMKRGLVAVCRPLSPDTGAGFYVELPGRGEDSGGEDPGGEDPDGEDPDGENPGGEDAGGEGSNGADPDGETPEDTSPAGTTD